VSNRQVSWLVPRWALAQAVLAQIHPFSITSPVL
jgi:hypothetical protein